LRRWRGGALGRSPDIAVNHDPEAIAMHTANHPETKHYTESVWEVDPRKATGGRDVALAWFSPDCKHHSKAKGGKPREQKIRGLAWVAVTWAQRVRPRLIILENVEEFQDWGPLHRVGERAGQPIKERKGETFRAFVGKLRKFGYAVEWKLLRACDFGAPTTRRRLFLQASLDAIAWPEPTHGPGRAEPYRTAAECIDWSIACPSIFSRERPLADKTLARIARGIRKYVIETARPFIVKAKTHGGGGNEPMSIDEPLRTITASKRGEFAVIAPYLVHRSNGERVGQEPRIYNAQEPLRTIVSQGEKFALCAAFLAKHYGARNPDEVQASGLGVPIGTVTCQDHHSLVACFLARYNGTSTGQPVTQPLTTIDTRDRFGLVTVTIDGEEYAIVDIGMRMLTPRELFRAQGFPDTFHIDPVGPNGKPLSKTAQIRMCGNSVSPVMPLALLRASAARARRAA
jgi:DNA (cytosine-5)-methyltransferase 1